MVDIHSICCKALNADALSREESIAVIELPESAVPELVDEVFKVRKQYKGLRVGVQLLTNARSGDCTQNCAYCAQSRDSKAAIEKYKMVSFEKTSSDRAMIQGKQLARHCIGLSGLRFHDKEGKLNAYFE
jgi:biotin synthase